MELVDLSFIIAMAKREHEGRGIIVLLNRGTYTRLLRNLQLEWAHGIGATPPPPSGATFEYCGRTVSWTPALDNFPNGYSIGEVWRGAE